MSALRPIGSEKLTGKSKIDRMLEIARYNENNPNPINEVSKTTYDIEMADGEKYFIVKEKSGYVIKKGLNEQTADYIEPMKNRKYYRSYGLGLKRLNIIATEINRTTGNDSGISLFGEQKRYTLKTPKPAQPEPVASAIPDTPPPVPSPELPPAPTDAPDAGMETGMPDMGAEMPDMGGDLSLGGAEQPIEGPDAFEDDEVTFKTIQKITGKLTQKIRVFDRETGMTSDEVKYVLNMLISALDLQQLTEEDMEDIKARLEEKETDYEESPEMGVEEPMDMEEPTDMGEPMEMPKVEAGESYDYKNRFSESKVSKLIASYFDVANDAKIKTEKNQFIKQQLRDIEQLSESDIQKKAAKKFLIENKDFKFIGVTNLKNLVFENKNEKIKINTKGRNING